MKEYICIITYIYPSMAKKFLDFADDKFEIAI